MFSPVKIALIRKTCCQRNTFFVPHYWKIFGSRLSHILSVIQDDYHINISSDDYSDNDIEKCMLDMEKEGLLHFWEQKVYLGDSTSTDHCTDFHLRVTINYEACEKFLASIK